jgi:hypothetical protein
MKKIYFLQCVIIILSGCNAKKNTQDVITEVKTEVKEIGEEGIVSHEFHANGCPTVIKMVSNNRIFLPFESLEKDFDIDKLSVYITYNLSKRSQPQGCSGSPITIKTISKK